MLITGIIIGTIVLLIVVLIVRMKKQMAALKNVKESEKVSILNDQNFTNKTRNGFVLVDF